MGKDETTHNCTPMALTARLPHYILYDIMSYIKRRRRRPTGLRRHSIVLGDGDDALLESLVRELGLPSKSAAVRVAIAELDRRRRYDAIRAGYARRPESPKEIALASETAKAAARGLSKEEW